MADIQDLPGLISNPIEIPFVQKIDIFFNFFHKKCSKQAFFSTFAQNLADLWDNRSEMICAKNWHFFQKSSQKPSFSSILSIFLGKTGRYVPPVGAQKLAFFSEKVAFSSIFVTFSSKNGRIKEFLAKTTNQPVAAFLKWELKLVLATGSREIRALNSAITRDQRSLCTYVAPATCGSFISAAKRSKNKWSNKVLFSHSLTNNQQHVLFSSLWSQLMSHVYVCTCHMHMCARWFTS